MKLALTSIDITPQENVPLLGYGDRTHDSVGVHDPLRADAWWIQPDDQAPLIWIVLDVCLMSVATTRDLAARCAARTGLRADRIIISATHTHSGPDVRMLHVNPAPWAARYRDHLVQQLQLLIQSARSSAFDGEILVRQGGCDIGVNRRDTTLPIDPRVVLLHLVDRAGNPRGMLFHYACHLTVLGVDNYLISADWLGFVREQLEREFGHPVAFLQGTEGNIDPRCRGVLDMGDPNQARGSSLATCRQLADEMAHAIRQAALTPPLCLLSTATRCDGVASLPLRYGALSADQINQRIAGWKRDLGQFLGVDPAQVPENAAINAQVKARCRELDLPRAQTRQWVARQFAYGAFLNMYKHGGGELVDREHGLIRLPLSLLDLGPLVVLCVPAEVLVEIGFEWQRRLAGRVALIAALANGWSGYLPHADNFAEPDADARYETVSSVFAPDAATTMLDAAMGLVSGA